MLICFFLVVLFCNTIPPIGLFLTCVMYIIRKSTGFFLIFFVGGGGGGGGIIYRLINPWRGNWVTLLGESYSKEAAGVALPSPTSHMLILSCSPFVLIMPCGNNYLLIIFSYHYLLICFAKATRRNVHVLFFFFFDSQLTRDVLHAQVRHPCRPHRI